MPLDLVHETPLTTEAAAELLGVTPKTVGEWMRRGKLESTGIGKRRYTTREAINRAQTGGAPPTSQEREEAESAEYVRRAEKVAAETIERFRLRVRQA